MPILRCAKLCKFPRLCVSLLRTALTPLLHYRSIKKWNLAGPQPLSAEIGENKSGIWLFTDRTTPNHFFPPNFLPPYDTEEKRDIILAFLAEEWDDKSLSWKPAIWNEKAVSAGESFMGFCNNPIESLLRPCAP